MASGYASGGIRSKISAIFIASGYALGTTKNGLGLRLGWNKNSWNFWNLHSSGLRLGRNEPNPPKIPPTSKVGANYLLLAEPKTMAKLKVKNTAHGEHSKYAYCVFFTAFIYLCTFKTVQVWPSFRPHQSARLWLNENIN